MAWIRLIHENEVEGGSRLERLYKACVEPETGEVDNILKVHGLRPDTLRAHLDLYKTAMAPRPGAGPALSLRERELIAVCVSQANACHY